MSEQKTSDSAHTEGRGRVMRQGGPGRGGPAAALSVPPEKAKNFKKTASRLIKYLSPEWHKFLAVFLLAILSSVFSITGPKIIGSVTNMLSDEVLSAQAGTSAFTVDFGYIGRTLLTLAALYVISSLCSYVMGFLMSDVSQKTAYSLRKEVKRKLDLLPLKYFDSRSHGEILSRITNDMDNIASTLQQSLTQLITSVVTIVGVLIMMFTISPVMTLIALFTLPLSAFATVFIAKKSQKYFKSQQKELGELNGHVEEMLSGHKIVKAFGREKSSISEFEKINASLYEASWRAQVMSGIMMPVLNFVSNFGYVLICIAGGVLAATGKIKIGDVQAFIMYMKQNFTQPIVQTANIANIIQSTIASAERVFDILDETEQSPDPVPAAEIPSPRGDVTFESVRFGYSDEKILIENMKMEVEQGQTIAIVGPTGAGKTTVVNLLMRFYELNGGRITIDGTDITKMKRNTLHGLFGMVLQDTWLFSGSIAENIAYGKKDATEEEIAAAAKAAYADRFIRMLPDGLNTQLNEEASNISQGQKQLLTIARAILSDPAILILDEATSSVDTRTELLIQKAMKNLMQGRTSFVIAHRLSTIKNADFILVMKKGSIVEKGTHSELLAAGGFYAELYNS